MPKKDERTRTIRVIYQGSQRDAKGKDWGAQTDFRAGRQSLQGTATGKTRRILLKFLINLRMLPIYLNTTSPRITKSINRIDATLKGHFSKKVQEDYHKENKDLANINIT